MAAVSLHPLVGELSWIFPWRYPSDSQGEEIRPVQRDNHGKAIYKVSHRTYPQSS
jgi:hypothetical protein